MRKVSEVDVGESGDAARLNGRAIRLYNLRAFISSLGIGFGLTLVMTSSMVAEVFSVRATLVLSAGSALAAFCTAEIVSLYLRGKINFGSVTTLTFSTSKDHDQSGLSAALDRVEAALKEVTDSGLNEGAAVWKETDRRLAASREVFADAKRRLSEQVAVLERRARVNLVTGCSTTVGAVAILLAFAFSPPHLVELSWQQLLSLYLPKLGVVVMLEVFAFFFLRLYKGSLDHLRALHADLDVLALKEAALITAWVDVGENRLESARLLVTPNYRDSSRVVEGQSALDPKAVAEMVAAIAKIVRP